MVSLVRYELFYNYFLMWHLLSISYLLSGAVGSMDCTHVRWNQCPVNLTNFCTGKEKVPTLAFNCIVDHSRRILWRSNAFYGAINDITICHNDSMCISILNDRLADIEFKMFNENDEIIKCCRSYLLVDGGFLNFGCFVPPFKECLSREAILWSEWLESLRKDVECTFGILTSILESYAILLINTILVA